jgi:hypothetical protein
LQEDGNISICTECGVRGTNWGQDCPNILYEKKSEKDVFSIK